MKAAAIALLFLVACADDPAVDQASRPIIDIANEMCVQLTGLELSDAGVCEAADLRCTPTYCCWEDWEFCCVGVPGPDGPVVICG